MDAVDTLVGLLHSGPRASEAGSRRIQPVDLQEE